MNGVKQGCVLAPMLFSSVLNYAVGYFLQRRPSIMIIFKARDRVFDLRRLQIKSKMEEDPEQLFV